MAAHSDFLQQMLDDLPKIVVPDGAFSGTRPLSALTTRQPQDPTIALLSAWACVCDIIAFYQERLANEGFLPSAEERFSLTQLARLIGYQPRPGLGASAYLAFTVEDQDGSDREVRVPETTQVQSVPDADQLPQTFETSTDLSARLSWNSLQPRLTRPQLLTPDSRGVYLRGTTTDIKPGDSLLMVRKAGDLWRWKVLRLLKVESDTERDWTWVEWSSPLGPGELLPDPAFFALRLQASLFGFDAPDWKTQPLETKFAYTPSGYEPQDFDNWPGFDVQPGPFDLDSIYNDVLPESWIVRQKPGAIALDRVGATATISRNDFTISAQVTTIGPSFHEEIESGRSLAPGREAHTATLLPDGTVLVVGGRNKDGALASARLYDPVSGAVTEAASLSEARWNHTTTLLSDETLIVVGGENETGPLASAEVYYLSGPYRDTFRPATGRMATARARHRSTLLPDGTVVITGGAGASATLDTAELFAAASQTFSALPNLSSARQDHTATLYLVQGEPRVLIAGGKNETGVLSRAENYVAASRSFVAISSSMTTARACHSGTLLAASGALLLCGGYAASDVGSSPSAETYQPVQDPASGTFQVTGSLKTPRWNHTATALQDGTILIAGGQSSAQEVLAQSEAFDPASAAFLMRIALARNRTCHSATLLADGSLALAGGSDGAEDLDSVERYQPAVNTFVPTGNLTHAAFAQAGALLETGNLLVCGGASAWDVSDKPIVLLEASIYDPRTGLFNAARRMNTGRAWHTATLLPNGSVLVAGGLLSRFDADILEILDMLEKLRRTIESSQPLLDDVEQKAADVEQQVDGIQQDLEQEFAGSARIDFDIHGWDYKYHFETRWTPWPVQITYSQDYGDTFVWALWQWQQTYLSLLPYDVQARLNKITLDADADHGIQSDVVALEALLASELEQIDAIVEAIKDYAEGALLTAEVYDPTAGIFTATNEPMHYFRRQHSATLMQNGKVLLVGGLGRICQDPPESGSEWLEVPLPTAELFDPGAKDFTITAGSLNTGRYGHTATLLSSGFVLIAGGQTFGNFHVTDSVELYNPDTDRFSEIGKLVVSRAFHTATLLPGGQVLIAGGVGEDGSPLSACEVFQPQTGWFVRVGDLAVARTKHAAELLRDSLVLVAGGQSSAGTLRSCEIFDPMTGLFSPANDMRQPREEALAWRLPGGSVLVAGGEQGADPQSSTTHKTAEIFVCASELVDGNTRRNTIVLAQSEQLPMAPEPLTQPVFGDLLVLDLLSPELKAGQKLLLTGKPLLVSVTPDAPPLELSNADGKTSVLNHGDVLKMISPPVPAPEGTEAVWHLESQMGFRGTVAAPHGALEEKSGSDETASELIRILTAGETPDRQLSELQLTQPLRYSYERLSVSIAANVVQATQGASIADEVLGSGNAGLRNQTFVLQQGPLIYLPAVTAKGYRSTVRVRVDGVEWQEVATLFEAGADDQAYAVGVNLSGNSVVVFGDGIHGSRLPTGVDNVIAGYRIGKGADGNIPPNRLSIVSTPPEGIAAAINPLQASGGTGAESARAIRSHTPESVLDLERILSPADLRSFALNFAGIAKAEVSTISTATGMQNCLTIAAESGQAFSPGSELFDALVLAIASHSHPGFAAVVLPYEQVFFDVAALLRVDARYDPKTIVDAAAGRLVEAFGFDGAEFAKGLAASTVTAALQSISGVQAVSLTTFCYSTFGVPVVLPYLNALPAREVDGRLLPSQILMIRPDGISITEENAR